MSVTKSLEMLKISTAQLLLDKPAISNSDFPPIQTFKAMSTQKRSTRTAPIVSTQVSLSASASRSAPMLTPLALLLLGAVQMARAQAERPELSQDEASAEQARELAAVALAADAELTDPAPLAEAPAPEQNLPLTAELLALLQTLADGARQAAEGLNEAEATAQTPEASAVDPAQAGAAPAADHVGQLDRAEAILEAYQSLIDQLPAELVLAQVQPATTVAAGEAAGASAAAGLSMPAILAGLLGLAALGGGGGGGGGPSSTVDVLPATDIVLHDGYVDGASIYLDTNNNGKIDQGTDRLLGLTKNGKLSAQLTDTDKLSALLAQGGTDISTGSSFEGVYSTTAGSAVINPLTTLIQTLVQTTVDTFGTLSAADKVTAVRDAKSVAMATVSSALGIDSDVDLTKIDTVQASSSASSASLSAGDAIELHSKALMVANMISVGSATLTGAVGTGTADLSQFVVKGIVSSITAASASGEVVSFKSADTITQMLNSAVSAAKTGNVAVNDSVMEAAASSVSGAVASANQLINAFAGEAAKAVGVTGASATAANAGLTQMLQAQKVVLNQVQELKKGSESDLTALTGLRDTATLLTQAQAVTTGLKIGETAANAVTRATDTTAPTVASVDIKPARVGDLAQVVVQMSESVLVSGDGRPSLAISTGTSTTATAMYDKGLSVGDTLVFTYRVQAGDTLVQVANNASLSLNGASIKDLAGNNAVAAIATGKSIDVDSVAPTVSITSDAAFVKAGATATLTFTLSEAASTRTAGAFTADDVTVKNGTLTNFAQDAINPLKYTAKLAATSATALAEVGMAGGRFTDAAGNANQPSNVVLLAQEGAAPVVSVSAGQSFFNSVNAQGTPSTPLTFSLSADSTDFAASDVTVTGGGELTGFSGSGKSYTATLSGITSDTQVKVGKDAFGVTGTTAKNADSNTLGFKVDTAKPTVSIAMLKGATGTEAMGADSMLKAGDTARVSFTFSEEVKGFDLRAVKVAGGSLDNLVQDKTDAKKFTATFKTADAQLNQVGAVDAAISVDANRVTDMNGNANDRGAFSFKVDNVRPSVLSVSDNVAGALKAGATVAYTYTLNKPVTGLEASDFVATNGAVQSVEPVGSTQVGTTGAYSGWTVNVTPAANVAAGRIGLTLKAGSVLDAAGNPNQAHSQNVQALDTVAPTATLELDRATFLKASANNGQAMTGTVSVNFSEPVANLQASALSASGAGGSFSNLTPAADGRRWTATFTPNEADAAGEVKVQLAGGYQDAAGNTGAAAESAALRTNVVAPVLSITAANTALKTTDSNTTLSFTFSEAVTGFAQSDVTVTGGSLSAFTQVSSTLWTALFTPTASSSPSNASVTVANQTFASTAASIDGFGGKVDLKTNLTNPGLSATPSLSATTVAGTAGDSAGEAVMLTLNFDSNVRGLTSGSNSTVFTLGGTGVSAVWAGTEGSNTRTLTYTVVAGQNGQPAIDEAALKAALVAGISNADGLAFVQSANGGNIANIDATPLPVFDTTVATLGSTAPGVSTTTVAGTAGNSVGEAIVLTVNFDGNVSGLSSGTNTTVFTLGGTGVNAVWGGVAGSSSRTLTYTVATGQNGQAAIDEAALKAALTAGITDLAGNAFSYTANSGAIANIDATPLPVIDTTAPSLAVAVTAVVDNVGALVGNLASGAVTDDTSVSVTGTLGGATAGASLPNGETLKVFDGATLLGTATVTAQAGGQSTWSYTDTRTLAHGQSLSYTARLSDEAGNESPAGTPFLMTVDTVAPAVTSMVSTPSQYLSPSANGGQVQTGEIKVAFSEPVTGLSVDDFELKFGSVVQTVEVRAAALSNVAGSGKDWTVKFTPPALTAGSSTPGTVDSVSLLVKGGYADMAGNAGTASASPLNMLVNQSNPVLSLSLERVSASGDLIFSLSSSDPTVSGLTASDFSASNGAVVGNLQAVANQAGQYTLSVTPAASGAVVVSAAQGAGSSASNLPTLAVASTAVNVIKGSAGNDTLELTNLKEIVVLGGGSDVIKVASLSDSLASARDLVAGVSSNDVIDMTALFNKIGTVSQYFAIVDERYTGQPVAGWLQAVDKLPTVPLGTPGDNQIFFVEKVEGNQVTLSLVYDTDSRLGTTTVSEVGELRLLAADAAAMQGFLNENTNNDYVLVDKIAPTLSVAMDAGKTTFTKTNPGTATVQFTSNEILSALPKTAVTVVGGSISAPVQSANDPRVWTATFTPTSDATLTSGSISVAASGYQDLAGNAGLASNSQALTLNILSANLSLNWVDATPNGQMTYKLVSDMALTGLDASDFNGTGYTANSVNAVDGSAGKQYLVNILPTASGSLTLALAGGAATANGLPTPAVSSQPAAVQVVQASANGGEISVSGAGERLIVLGAGADTVKLPTIVAGSGSVFMGVIAGAGVGDKLDIGSALKVAGYVSVAQSETPDPANAFVKIANMVVEPVVADKATYVSFDVMLTSPTVGGSRINGLTLDLAYDSSSVVADSMFITSRTYPATRTSSPPLLDIIVPNEKTGQIAASSSKQTLFNTYDITTESPGKVLSVSLTLDKVVNSFAVGFDTGSGNSISLVTGTAPALITGSTKTGYAGGSSLMANVLNIAGSEATSESAMPATPGDNQLRYVEIVESSASNAALLKFQFDADPSVGKTSLSPVIELDILSNDLAAFLNTDYVKLI